jgi:hypothetical protein
VSATSDLEEKAARRFLWRSALAAGCTALTIAALNAVVDPLNLFQRSDAWSRFGCAPGFRLEEPYALRLAARDSRADVLLTGTSRVRVGHEAADPALASAGARAFNLGLSAASMTAIERNVALATSEHAPRTLVVGLSLGSFLVGSPEGDRGTEPVSRLRAWLHNLFSSASTRESITTLTDRGRCRQPVRLSNGDGPHMPKPIGEPSRARVAGAVDAMFAERYAAALRQMRHDRRETALHDERLAAFSTLLTRECTRGTRVLLFFEPSHVRMLEVIRAVGLWNDYERLKRHVTEEVTRAREAGCVADLWDFTGYNRYSSESFDGQEALYFWESSHYTPVLGRLITRRLVGAEDPGDGFGRRLAHDTVEGHLARLRAGRDAFVEHNPATVEYVERLLAASQAR